MDPTTQKSPSGMNRRWTKSADVLPPYPGIVVRRLVPPRRKVLQDAGIKLTSVASTILGKTGRAILEALLAGQDDPAVLAELAKGRLRPKIPALRQALTHRFRDEHHGLLVAQMLAHVDFLEASIAQTYQQVDVLLRSHHSVLDLVMTIPGVARRVAEVLVAEVGLDMSVFPSAGHLASWAGICPGNNSSGGKRRSGPTRYGSVWLRIVLTEAAQAAARTKGTYLAAHHAQIRAPKRLSAPPVTTFSSPITTLFEIVLPTMTSDRTGMTGSAQPTNKHADSCANSKNSE
ncbi:MAG TPA: IS110 family transposase [Pseudonocardiaceae bacterium]|nr:IS110 family transposase [Pseudonocardiaceae bacterium]